MDANVYQHFRKDEHPFIDMVEGWIKQVDDLYVPVLTDFLDPRQAFILETLVRRNQLPFMLFGGYEQAERKRALIYPDYYTPNDDDFQMTLIAIQYPQKFGELSHGKILGTLVSSGMKREKFGDIISDGVDWQFFVEKDIASYVMMSVDKIGKLKVRLEEINYTQLILPKDVWTEERTTVSSLRLDNIISTVFNISRQRSKQLIESGKIKVNWVETEKVDFGLELLDIISIRGFGRIQIQGIEGKTKKEKYRLLLGVLRK